MVDNWTPVFFTIFVILFLISFRKKPKMWKVPAQQSIPSSTRNKGESPIYRCPSTPHGTPLITSDPRFPQVKTVYDAFMNGYNESKSKPCMGVRINDGPYVWETYSEVYERIKNFGSGLLECGLLPKKEHCVGVMSKNCPEWCIAEVACSAYSLVIVPLYDTLGPDAIKFIINQAELSVVVVEGPKLENLLAVANQCPTLKYVIKIGQLTPEDKKMAKEAKVSLLYFKGVEALGKDQPKPVQPSQPTDLLTICYTSGTTGDPKGVLLTHSNVIAEAAGVLATLPPERTLTANEVHLSFLPLAHIFEQLIFCALVGVGGRIAFYRGDVLKLLEDVAEAQPTLFPAVPRLLNRIYGKIMQTVNESSTVRKFIFNYALEAKKRMLSEGVVTKESFWDKLVFNKIQKRLGGKVELLITGAAPISADVLQFFRAVFGCEVLEGYGQTETCAAATITRFGDYSVDHGGHVGGVIGCCEIKLVDIPEMNYFSTDENPRGEVWIRGENVFKGYFKLPDKTRETLTEDGWCKTGDVGMMLPGGTLKIIDRKKHIFKLSQGEYIAPEKIENIYTKAPFVAQVFVHGESIKSSLVGIIVVDNEQVSAYCSQKSIEYKTEDDWLNQKSGLKQVILKGLVDTGKANKLHSFEQVKDIYLTFRQFTAENGLLTPSFKSKRPEIKKFYQAEIDKLYSNLD